MLTGLAAGRDETGGYIIRTQRRGPPMKTPCGPDIDYLRKRWLQIKDAAGKGAPPRPSCTRSFR